MENEPLQFQQVKTGHLFEIGQYSMDKSNYMHYAMALKIDEDTFRIVESWSSRWGVGFQYKDKALNPTAALTDHGEFNEDEDITDAGWKLS